MSSGTNLLYQLIIEKYGIEKFDTGCQLVAQWLNYELATDYTAISVKKLAEAKSNPKARGKVRIALKKLFGKAYDP